MLGRLEQAQGNLAAAGRAYDQALRYTPADGRLWVDIGRLRYASGEQLEAIAAADQALAVAPTEPRALEFRGQLDRDQYGPISTLPWFERGLALASDDSGLLGEYAARLGELGRAHAMLKITRHMLALDPGNPRALLLQAMLAGRAGRWRWRATCSAGQTRATRSSRPGWRRASPIRGSPAAVVCPGAACPPLETLDKPRWLGQGQPGKPGIGPLRFIDPLVALILAAILLATVLPVGGDARAIAQGVSNAAVFLLFLVYGLRLARAEVLAGLGNHRLLGPLVAWVFGAMTLAGWLIWRGGGLISPELALGFLYLGVLPSTVQSATAYSSQAGGNVASSVVAAALLNIVGVFVSAPLFGLLAGSDAEVLRTSALMKIGTMLLLPFAIGQVLQGRLGAWVRRRRDLTTAMDRGAIAIAVYVAFSGAVEQGIWSRVDLAAWGVILAGCAVLLIVGYGGAWLLGHALRLPRGDRIAMLFAGAQKSIAMGAPLATVLFPPAAVGVVLLPLLVYHLAQMVVAAPIAARLARNPQSSPPP